MKLIDEKGRLFGKLNIIDLLIVLIIFAGIFGINYKLGFIKQIGAGDSQKRAEVKLWVKNIAPYTVDAISEGDAVKEVKSNTVIGKIIKKEVRPTKDVGTDASGKWVISEVPERYDVFITLETSTSTVNQDIKLGSKEAKVGAGLDVKGPKFQVTSYVIGVE